MRENHTPCMMPKLVTDSNLLCRMHRPIAFCRNNSGKLERLGRNFTGRRRLTGHVHLQTFGVLCAKKAAFCELFCRQKNASYHALLGGQFPWNLNTKRKSVLPRILSEQSCETFSIRDLPKKHFRGFSVHFRWAPSSLSL